MQHHGKTLLPVRVLRRRDGVVVVVEHLRRTEILEPLALEHVCCVGGRVAPARRAALRRSRRYTHTHTHTSRFRQSYTERIYTKHERVLYHKKQIDPATITGTSQLFDASPDAVVVVDIGRASIIAAADDDVDVESTMIDADEDAEVAKEVEVDPTNVVAVVVAIIVASDVATKVVRSAVVGVADLLGVADAARDDNVTDDDDDDDENGAMAFVVVVVDGVPKPVRIVNAIERAVVVVAVVAVVVVAGSDWRVIGVVVVVVVVFIGVVVGVVFGVVVGVGGGGGVVVVVGDTRVTGMVAVVVVIFAMVVAVVVVDGLVTAQLDVFTIVNKYFVLK
jgi:hypothetical protein